MEIVGIIGLLCAIAVMVIGAYKGLGPLPLTIIAAAIAILTNGLNVWEAYSSFYMAGYAGTYTSYFLIFISPEINGSILIEAFAEAARELACVIELTATSNMRLRAKIPASHGIFNPLLM